jgi:hypothetical protein
VSIMTAASNITARTQFLEIGTQRYAYRRFGGGSGCPLLFLQHFTGTLDNWDPAVTDPLAVGREVILCHQGRRSLPDNWQRSATGSPLKANVWRT